MIRAASCSCGGRLRRASIGRPALEPLFGLKGAIEGMVPGLRCDSCGNETFEGATVERMLLAVARKAISQPHILSGDEARFLRKALLGATQEQLAKRMGINKITIADWERGERRLSKEHDYELRGIALSGLFTRLVPSAPKGFGGSFRALTEVLRAPRLVGPPRRARPYRIPSSELVPA